MSTITEFLLQRIAEDEVVARAAPGPKWLVGYEREGAPGRWNGIAAYLAALPPSGPTSIIEIGDEVARSVGNDSRAIDHITRHDPARVLAECDTKQWIAELHRFDMITDCVTCEECWPCETILALAAVYADHPDFDPAWRR